MDEKYLELLADYAARQISAQREKIDVPGTFERTNMLGELGRAYAFSADGGRCFVSRFNMNKNKVITLQRFYCSLRFAFVVGIIVSGCSGYVDNV